MRHQSIRMGRMGRMGRVGASVRAFVVTLAACGGGLAACGGGSVSASGSASGRLVIDELADPAALTGCATGDVPANLAIVADLRDSYHEMIVCGGLALDFSSSIANVLVNAALGRGRGSVMQYRGNGEFATPNGLMSIRTTLADGQPLAFDPLDPQSYLVGFQVSAQASSALDVAARGGSPLEVLGRAAGDVEIRFTAAGPGAALLGIAVDELRGGTLLTSPRRIARAIAAAIHVANRISVQDVKGGTTIHYILEGAPQPVADMLSRKAVPMKLVSIVATHASTGQSIRITDWTMQFKGDGGRVLDGAIALDVEGGTFPYAVRYTYPHRADPDVDLTCR